MSSQPYYAHGNAPIIVQGQDVTTSAHYNHQVPSGTVPVSTYSHHNSTTATSNDEIGSDRIKGERQQSRCNDVFFAILFYAHLGFMVYLSAVYIPQMYSTLGEGFGDWRHLTKEDEYHITDYLGISKFSKGLMALINTVRHGAINNGSNTLTDAARYLQDDGDEDIDFNVNGLLAVLSVTFVIGFLISALTLSFMMAFAESLIKVALLFNVILSLVIALLALVSGALPFAIMSLLFFALTAYYAYCVWNRIPFAASNLRTACTAIRANIGVAFFAYMSLIVIFLWSVFWSLASVATLFVTNGCNANGECENQPNGLVIFGLLVSYFWTASVIRNTVHVTSAGTVGTWWFVPAEANSCCSSGVRDSWIRSVTSSFGSICLGSLIVAIIQATKEIVHQLRESGDSMLLCCAECLLGCIERLVEYFNQWAYVFVAVYGYSFMEAGQQVMNLFRSRGWTAIITDSLIDNVLSMISIGVGLLTGLLGAILAWTFGLDVGGGGIEIASFVVGLVIGSMICATLMSVVGSAVHTVIVLYAEAPAEFQLNHPQLSDDMRMSWRQAWPNDFRY